MLQRSYCVDMLIQILIYDIMQIIEDSTIGIDKMFEIIHITS